MLSWQRSRTDACGTDRRPFPLPAPIPCRRRPAPPAGIFRNGWQQFPLLCRQKNFSFRRGPLRSSPRLPRDKRGVKALRRPLPPGTQQNPAWDNGVPRLPPDGPGCSRHRTAHPGGARDAPRAPDARARPVRDQDKSFRGDGGAGERGLFLKAPFPCKTCLPRTRASARLTSPLSPQARPGLPASRPLPSRPGLGKVAANKRRWRD